MTAPRQSVPELTCHILDTGHCLAHEHILIQGAREGGGLPLDCGAARPPAARVAAVGRRLCAAHAHGHGAFPVFAVPACHAAAPEPELAAAAQLGRLNLATGDIGAIFISHFHADHIAGLADFPSSRFVALREAYGSVAKIRGLRALRRAFVPSSPPVTLRRASPCLTPSPAPRCPASALPTTITATARCCLSGCPGMRAARSGCSPIRIVAPFSSLPTAAGWRSPCAKTGHRRVLGGSSPTILASLLLLSRGSIGLPPHGRTC